MTGIRPDTQAVLQDVFRPREMSRSESVLEYARERQGTLIAVVAFVAFLVLAALHQFVTARNAAAASDAPPVPLTEITDVTARDEAPVPIPEVDFQYDGDPQRLRTFVVEPGAAPPRPAPAAGQAGRPAGTAAPGTASQ